MSFLGEIKRRKVFQVGAVYLVVAWLIMQVVDVVAEPLNLPGLFATIVIVLLAIGLPIALIFAWVFDVTPDGVVRDTGQPLPKGRSIDYVLFGVLIVAVGWVLYRVEFDQPESIADSAQSAETAAEEVTVETSAAVIPNSIAVLPFENLSLDPEDAFFAAGIHESTLNQLAKIRDLIVIARTSVLQYESNPPPIPEIAEALKVESVLEGSVRYANGRVLIAAQLIDGRTGGHLWSNEYNRELTDVFAVQADVARHIASAMQVQLLPQDQARIESRPTESAEAYEYYLQALSLPHFIGYPEYRDEYIHLLEQAISEDAEFADAYANLGLGYNRRGELDLAINTARKAISLNSTSGLAYYVLGVVLGDYYSRQEESATAFERAVELSPNDPFVLIRSIRHLAEITGEYDEAIRLSQRAIAIDPNDSRLHRRLGFIYLRAGDLTNAARHYRELLSLVPGTYDNYIDLAIIAYLDGDPDIAREHLDHAAQMMSLGETFRVHYLAYLYGLLGDTDQASIHLVRLERLIAEREGEIWPPLGWAALGTRDKERALQDWTITIEGYIENNRRVSPGNISRFIHNWLNDPMLEEPEFLELRRRLGYDG